MLEIAAIVSIKLGLVKLHHTYTTQHMRTYVPICIVYV